jgi:hypothetical protein
MARKVGDLTVVVGEYQSQGQTKKKYQKVGVAMKDDQSGNFFLLINRFFNFAGVPGSEGKESVLVNLFADDKGKGGEAPQGQHGGQGGYSQGPATGQQQGGHGGQGVQGQGGFQDDIPGITF